MYRKAILLASALMLLNFFSNVSLANSESSYSTDSLLEIIKENKKDFKEVILSESFVLPTLSPHPGSSCPDSRPCCCQIGSQAMCDTRKSCEDMRGSCVTRHPSCN